MQNSANSNSINSNNWQSNSKNTISSAILPKLVNRGFLLSLTAFLGIGTAVLAPNQQSRVVAASVNAKNFDLVELNSLQDTIFPENPEKSRFPSRSLLKIVEKITTKLFPGQTLISSDRLQPQVTYPWQLATNINRSFALDSASVKFLPHKFVSNINLKPTFPVTSNSIDSHFALPKISNSTYIASKKLFTSSISNQSLDILDVESDFLNTAIAERKTKATTKLTKKSLAATSTNHIKEREFSTKAIKPRGNDFYIARLRADIEKLHALNRASRLGIGGENRSISDKPVKRLRGRFSRKNSREDKSNIAIDSNAIGEINKPEKPQEVISVAPSNPENYNSALKTPTGEVINPQLPSLAAAEEYLPKAFEGYDWPAKGVLSSGYGWRWGKLHKGIDIAAPIGTPVFAAAKGEVIFADWNSGGYGKLIKMRHPDGSVTFYAHNNKLHVRKGQRVNQGELIAEIGNTGFSTGPHLHFEIRLNGDAAVNPMAYLGKR